MWLNGNRRGPGKKIRSNVKVSVINEGFRLLSDSSSFIVNRSADRPTTESNDNFSSETIRDVIREKCCYFNDSVVCGSVTEIAVLTVVLVLAHVSLVAQSGPAKVALELVRRCRTNLCHLLLSNCMGQSTVAADRSNANNGLKMNYFNKNIRFVIRIIVPIQIWVKTNTAHRF